MNDLEPFFISLYRYPLTIENFRLKSLIVGKEIIIPPKPFVNQFFKKFAKKKGKIISVDSHNTEIELSGVSYHLIIDNIALKENVLDHEKVKNPEGPIKKLNILIVCHCKNDHDPLIIEKNDGIIVEEIDYMDIGCDPDKDQYNDWNKIDKEYDIIWTVHCPVYGKDVDKVLPDIVNSNILKTNGIVVIHAKGSREMLDLKSIEDRLNNEEFAIKKYYKDELFETYGIMVSLERQPHKEYLVFKKNPNIKIKRPFLTKTKEKEIMKCLESIYDKEVINKVPKKLLKSFDMYCKYLSGTGYTNEDLKKIDINDLRNVYTEKRNKKYRDYLETVYDKKRLDSIKEQMLFEHYTIIRYLHERKGYSIDELKTMKFDDMLSLRDELNEHNIEKNEENEKFASKFFERSYGRKKRRSKRKSSKRRTKRRSKRRSRKLKKKMICNCQLFFEQKQNERSRYNWT